MRFFPRFPRSFSRVALVLGLAAAPVAGAGFEEGEVHANAIQEIGGMTTSAAQMIDLKAISPPQTLPPPPPTSAPSVSSLKGTMNSVDLSSSGSITGTFNQVGSTGIAQVDFVDNLVVNADGIASGTDLIVEVTWNVSGRADYTSSSDIRNRAKLLLQADGINLDPNGPPTAKQEWTRDKSNLANVTEQFDPFGPVTFEFLVQAGTPDFAGNLRLRAVAGYLVGGPGSIFSGNYGADGTAEMTVEFVGATNVRLTDGRTLYKWTTNAQSGLDYGSRDDDPPSTPTLTVAPSPAGPKFSNLSWETVVNEYYLVQSSPDGSTWTTVTEVLATGGTVSIDVINPTPATIYRLIVELGSGNPTPSPLPPGMCLTRTGPGDLQVAWQTNHWENYALNELDDAGNRNLLHFVQGDGGAASFPFAFDPANPVRLFQIEAALK